MVLIRLRDAQANFIHRGHLIGIDTHAALAQPIGSWSGSQPMRARWV